MNRLSEMGPFDIVGDVHGCLKELTALMARLGYALEEHGEGFAVTPPKGRRLAFVGDLVMRGPDTAGVLRLVEQMVREGQALAVAGNQDMKLAGALKGNGKEATPGLARALEQLDGAPREFRDTALRFLESLPGHLVLDDGKLVIAHAGLAEALHGSGSARARRFATVGETTGETDDYGLPVRVNWAAAYRGRALVVFGHTPVEAPRWLNNTVNIDTGCVYGGHLTALRYPEGEIVQEPARRAYYPSRRRFPPRAGIASLSS